MQVLRMRSTARAAGLVALAATMAATMAGCGGEGGSTAAPAAKLLASTTSATANDGAHGGADTYTVVNLAPNIGYRSRLNARGQAAYEYVAVGDVLRVGFFDGDRISDITHPDAFGAALGDMNAHGEVTAYGGFPMGAAFGPFRWSPTAGWTLMPVRSPDGNTFTSAISKRGTVVGSSGVGPAESDYRATRWTAANVLEPLDTVPGGGYSFAYDINDHDVGAGFGADAITGVLHTFVWAADGTATDLGTLGASSSSGLRNNNRGEVSGWLDFERPDFQTFLWTPGKGVARVGLHTVGAALNDAGELVGSIAYPETSTSHAFRFTRAGGLADLHPATFTSSRALDVNEHGVIVGQALLNTPTAYDERAYRWSRTGAAVDLNTRLAGAPDGLTLGEALQVSPNGDIIANSNAGLVLLSRSGGTDAPVLGPMQVPGSTYVNQPLDVALSFRDRNTGDTHTATIDWGDGAGPQPAAVGGSGGSGAVSASHTYTAAGDYNVVVVVTDSGGRSTTQYRRISLYPYCVPGITGEASLAPATVAQEQRTLVMRLSAPLVSACGAPRPFTFALAGRLSFKGERLERVTRDGNTVRLEGTGKLAGRSGYRFAVEATDGNRDGRADPDRLKVRIVRADPAATAQAGGRQEVVLDYGTPVSKSQAARQEGILPNTALRLIE